MGVAIEVLGGTRILRDGREVDPGPRPLMVLALLVAADGETVAAEALADRLWRGSPPPSARTTLQGYIARLRRVLEPGVAAADARVLASVGPGYRLLVPDDAVDDRVFLRACAAARRHRGRGEDAAAARVLREALTLWGDPYPEVDDVDAVAPAVTRLREEHARALELLIAVRLDLGDGGVLPDAAAAAHRDPLREDLQLLHARALHAAGRRADALEVLRTTRERLADELGLDPSPALGDLETRLLRQDPALDGPAPPAPAPRSPTDPRPGAGARAALIGRDRMLAELDAAAARARTTRQVVVLTGEPGIGKSTLLAAFVAGLPGDVAVLRGRGLETAGVPPFWVWQQVLGELPAAVGTDAGARFALGVSVGRRLADLAARHPVVLALDDVQWVDEDSLHVLEVALAQLEGEPVLLVLLLRESAVEEPAVARVLASAARVDGARRMRLTGLDRDAVGELAARAGDDPWAAADVDTLHRRSAGNPFLAGELARLGPGSGGVPDGVRDVLRLRLGSLGGDVRDVLTAVALAGREVPLGLLADALGASAGRTDDAVGAAAREGLLDRPTPGSVVIRHDLVAEVARELVPATRRATLHLGLAEALGRRPSDPATTAAVAVHRAEAALGSPSPLAARACLAAASEAAARAADVDAAAFARRGLGLTAGDPALEADLLLEEGRALRRLGHLEEGGASLHEAGALARGLGDHGRLARAALASSGGGIGGYWGSMAAILETDASLLDQALAATATDGEPTVVATLLAASAVHTAARGLAGGPALADRALALAGEDPVARSHARVAAFVSRWTPAHAAERVEAADAMVAEARTDGDAAYEATALHLHRCALLEVGRVEESAAVSRRFTELAARRGDGDLLLLDLWWRVGLALAGGRHDEAVDLADSAVRSAPTASPAALALTRTSRQTVDGVIAWLERRMDGVVPDVADLATTVDPDWLLVLAQAHAQADRHGQALELVDRVLAAPRHGVREPVHAVLLADVLAEVGDRERAEVLLPTLESYGDTIVVLWVGTTVLGPVGLYRGSLKAVLGRPDAEDDLRRALDLAERAGQVPFARRARDRLDALAGEGA